MKKLISLLFLVLLAIVAVAQVSKTINVATAGSLGSLLTATEITTVTNLTLTGSIDARDFVTLRDAMTVLAVVDISTVNIAAYSGTDGTYGIYGTMNRTYPAKQLPELSFYNRNTYSPKTTLKTINLPNSVTSIGDNAFLRCSGLTSVTISTSVTSIGFQVFKGCSGLTSVTIPSSVTSIGENAFDGCTGLTSVTIPSSVTSIGSYTFQNCSGLTSVTIPSSVTSIGNYAFAGCTGLTSFTIPSSVTSIGSYTFSYCSGLTSVTIPSSVTSIGDNAFYYCTGLTSVTIPSSVTSIGNDVFFECIGLTSIIAYPATPVDFTSSCCAFGDVNKTTCILYVPSSSVSLYQSANQWKDFTNIRSIITTTQLSNITTTTASGGGNITTDGGLTITSRGVCWSTTTNPIVANSKTADGTGTGIFSSNITGLNPGTTYHIRAYATNSVGTAYGSDLTFTTLTIPTINTTVATSITTTAATSGGNITSDGGASITSRGVCWSTTANPTIANSKTTDGTGSGTFSSTITGLSPGTSYHIRAYATNSAGTAYGSDLTFTTSTIPTLITTAASLITGTTATSGGNITSDGGASITSRGVCWSTTPNPTIANSKSTDGTGSGTFISTITGLTPVTTYHIRAYATNSAGTAYGDDLTFSTSTAIPTLITTVASLITATSATTGGNITSDGGAFVTSRGVCWSSTANPTITNSKTTEGTGTGTFSSKITGLNPGTTYHIRAYATNSAGTAYGSDVTFTTIASSTEVYLNNIAFISSAQDATQFNVPSILIMNSSNPNNFMNPGKTVRFKMQCFNKKSNGINIVSGSCKVRCNDPYITLTDSTSGLNNVGYNASAWSTDEFEIQIKSTTPWGYVAYVDFVVIEGSNSYYTYKVPIPVAPLSLQSKTVDDDNNPDSKGNGNGICEPNEIIETLPSLQNVSILSANSVYGTFNNYYGVSGISVWNNKAGASGTVVNSGYWNYAFGAPQVITAGAKDMIPQWDFVFDYNFTSTYHFTMGLIMSGKFQLFSGYQSYIRWLIPVDYNAGYPDFNTGIRDNLMQKLTVYPNPTNGHITIVLDAGNVNEHTICLTNILGQKIVSSQLNAEKINLDLSKYCSKGIYFLQLLNDKGIIVGEKKVIFN